MVQQSIFAFKVADALGRQIEFDRAPARIVIAGRGLLMVADALYLFPEAAERLVAIEKITQGWGDFLDVVDPLFSEKITFPVNVGTEQILSARPDVVFLKSYMETNLGKPLERLGAKVVYLDFETPDQYERDILTIGKILQNESRAFEIIDYYKDMETRISGRISDLEYRRRPRALLLYYSNRDGKIAFNVPPVGWMQTIMVELAGGNALWKDMKGTKGWIKVGFEQIAAWDPEQIYITAYFSDPDEIVRELIADQKWQYLRAVRTNQIHAFPGDFFSWDQPDPRWILGLRWLATRIHPDIFQDIDIMRDARTFFMFLYRLDDAAFDRYIQPRLKGYLREE
jgi:iron complex transport system substrate-binding protein